MAGSLRHVQRERTNRYRASLGLAGAVFIAASMQSDAGAADLRVTEHGTARPLAGAEIRIHHSGRGLLAADLETDSDGRVHLPDLPSGDYLVEVVKANFVTTRLVARSPFGDLRVPAMPYGSIEGRVEYASGRPVETAVREPSGRTVGSTVAVLFESPSETSDPIPVRQVSLTDAGEYRFDVPPGKYVVGIWQFGKGESAGVRLYPDNRSPRILAVASGQTYRDVNFQLEPRPVYEVSGRVENPASGGGFLLALREVGTPSLSTARTQSGPGGAFRFPAVPAGEYELFAAGPVIGSEGETGLIASSGTSFGRVNISVGGQNRSDVIVPVSTGPPVRISIAGPDAGCPGAAELEFLPLEPWGPGLRRAFQLKLGQETLVSGLAPGRYRISDATLAQHCVLAESLLVDTRTASGRIEVRFEALGSIRGQIPAEGASDTTIAAFAGDAAVPILFTRPDLAGQFQFELPPGPYRIAWCPNAAGAANQCWRNVDELPVVRVLAGSAIDVVLPGTGPGR